MFWRTLCARRSRQPARHPGVLDRKEESFNGPPTNPADLCQNRDDFVVAHLQKSATGWQRAVHRFRSEILYRCDFCTRKTRGTKRLVRCSENLCGIEPFSFGIQRADAIPDRSSGFAM